MRDVILNSVAPLRKEKGLTQEDLAGSVGVTRQTIIAVEKGRYTPSLLLAFKLARFFRKKIEEIFQIK